MPYAPFVPLRVLSSYSLLEAAIDPKQIAKTAKEKGFPAIAICDRNGLYGTVAFAAACRAEGVQPIVGTLLGISEGDGAPIDYIPLYAQNEDGWNNLCHLVSRAHLDRPLELEPHVLYPELEGRTDGLIALTGAGEGAVTRLLADQKPQRAERMLEFLKGQFPDRLYVELSRRYNDTEDAAEEDLIELAYRHDLPLVATNPANFDEPHMHSAHDAMLCIAHSTHIDTSDRLRSLPDAYIKNAEMMEELFADCPEAMANTLVVAQRCAFAPPKRAPILPSLAGDLKGEEIALANDARHGLAARLSLYEEMSDEERETYEKRLEYEIDIIIGMGFPGYFLIVADFIKWAKAQGIPVGPGRGSGAGSLVAWALTITDLDPIRLGLLFERFLNPERVSMPDFDIDFCETRRGEVIRYVQNKYGHDHVAQIITFGKLKARAVLRDCGRILQMPYGQVDRLTKMVPNHPTDPWTLERTLNGEADFRREYDNDNEVKRLVDLAKKLEGFPRNSSTHAAGVVIGDRPLSQLVPLYRDPRSDMPVTQFDMKHVEDSGLVKFDFLGLKTLSVLRKAVDLLARRSIEVDLSLLPLDDPDVFALLKRGDTVGVFQLESEGMRRTLAAVKPTKFEDIIALVSLYRPGPMDNIPLFGKRKNGEVAIEYPHEKLAGILEETYGIFVYQEQVMQAAQILAGYSLGDADLLRRAMGKKIQAEMDKQRVRFTDGCKEVSGIEKGKANELFDLIDKFAGYGFNKSHAAAYALLSYQTAWVKTHYPEEFYAASMCFDMHQSEKLAIFVDDMRKNDIALRGPDLNASEAEFSVEQTETGHAVRYALAGIRNVGEKAMEAVVAEREKNGRFENLEDLFRRMPQGCMNRRQMEGLAGAGAFGSMEPNRAKVMANAEMLLAVAEASVRDRASGQVGLFGGDDHVEPALRLVDAEPWSRNDQMATEKDVFGFYFAAHPVEEFRAVASSNGARSYASLMAGGSGPAGRMQAVMAAMVESASKGTTRRGKDFVRADFTDSSGGFSAACFEESLVDSFLKWGRENTCVLLNVELDSPSPEEPPRVTIRGARALSDVTNSARMLLKLDIASEEALQELRLALVEGEKGAGKGEVIARLLVGEGESDPFLRLGLGFKLDGHLAEKLAEIDGLTNVALTTRRGAANLRLVA
ncbi:DNA polymerase III subunit alpha [Altericroceibacterium endophyticum]|uniref:DNA polymerase III subunit alpha n=1 Tax=Altericroceibacterium endophyticum TaxID=1808508 RepID=A0A6I4T7E4_9SPHN|nr:DNA polymerase III subunit alpha [Altericroceibacterium endophyticum]MXO66051.1 DNA polymerase III subunit alpha [Altericroceibacterium endophyticum]